MTDHSAHEAVASDMSSPRLEAADGAGRSRLRTKRARLALGAALVAFVGGALSLSGCAGTYVARAAYEEARILWRREPIDTLLAGPNVTPAMRQKLQLVLDVRDFAAGRIGLRVGGSFRSVSPVDGNGVVQLLTAARRDKLEAYTWWFPVVGRVPYKGFFSKRAAAATIAQLESDGYDTYVRPAIAFSTLGWFDDPLPSSLLRYDEINLAQVIFHELLHNTLYLPGETAFDESAATFVGHRASVEFFCEGERAVSQWCEAATADWQDTLTVSGFFATSLARLEQFYATKPVATALEEGRERAFREMREQFKGLRLHTGRYSDFAAGPINNASLLSERIYLRDLELFDRLYREKGNLRAAVEALRAAVDHGGDPFERLDQAVTTSRQPIVRATAGTRSG